MNEQTIRILLVEDEEAHADLVCRAFESQAGQARLTVVGSLREARACLVESLPDLVIADWVLPDGRGMELLPAEGEAHHFPVVMMTAHGDEQVAVEAIKAGALDYVVKSATTLADMPRIAERALREWEHIAARKEAEEEIKAKSQFLESLIEQSPLPTFVLDSEGILVMVNKAFLKAYNVPKRRDERRK